MGCFPSAVSQERAARSRAGDQDPGIQSSKRQGALASSGRAGPPAGMDGALAEEALSPSSGWVDRRMDGRRAEHTHREVCVEVVLPVKQGPPVDVAVQGQAGHHGCFHTPPV